MRGRTRLLLSKLFFLRGKRALLHGQIKQAMHLFHRAESLLPNSVIVWEMIIEQLLQGGEREIQWAEKLFTEKRARFSPSKEASYLEGKIALSRREYLLAGHLFTQAERLTPLSNLAFLKKIYLSQVATTFLSLSPFASESLPHEYEKWEDFFFRKSKWAHCFLKAVEELGCRAPSGSLKRYSLLLHKKLVAKFPQKQLFWRLLCAKLRELFYLYEEKSLLFELRDAIERAKGQFPQAEGIALWEEIPSLLYFLYFGRELLPLERSSSLARQISSLQKKTYREEAALFFILFFLCQGVRDSSPHFLYKAKKSAMIHFNLYQKEEFLFLSSIALRELADYFEETKFYLESHRMLSEKMHLFSPLSHSLLLRRECYWTFYCLNKQTEEVEEIRKTERAYLSLLQQMPDCFSLHAEVGMVCTLLGEITMEKAPLQRAIQHFETIINSGVERSVNRLFHPEWLYQYGIAYDCLGEDAREVRYYVRAIEIFSHLLNQYPDYQKVHYNLALAFFHKGELSEEKTAFLRCFFHFHQYTLSDSEEGAVWNDWGIASLYFSEECAPCPSFPQDNRLYKEMAERCFLRALHCGEPSAHYFLACLYSLSHHYEASLSQLKKAAQFSILPSREEIEEDRWLIPLKKERKSIFYTLMKEWFPP